MTEIVFDFAAIFLHNCSLNRYSASPMLLQHIARPLGNVLLALQTPCLSIHPLFRSQFVKLEL